MDNQQLKALGIDVGNYNIKSLFNEANTKSKKGSLERVKAVLKIYSSWINNQRDKNASDDYKNVNIYDLINNQLSPYYNFAQVQVDYQYIMSHPGILGYDNVDDVNDDEKDAEPQQDLAVYQSAVYNNNSLLLQANKKAAVDEARDGDDIYDATSDFIEDRHDRKKEYYTRFSNKLSGLFFTDNKSLFSNDISGESATKMAVAQQILDSIHSFIYHSIRIDVNELIRDQEEEIMDDEDCHDYVAEKVINTMERIRNSNKRFRARSNRDGNGTISKFVTSNEYHACFKEDKEESKEGLDGEDTTLQERIVCFVDGLFVEYAKSGVYPFSAAKVAALVLPEGYDTDAMCYDLFDESLGSNIRSFIGNCAENDADAALMNRICTSHYQKYVDAQSEYSVSYRMFYWPYYKNNQDTVNILFKREDGQQMIDSNENYRLCDWYIPAKHANFKQEIITNTTAPFSITDWNQIRAKSEEKLAGWSECQGVRKLVVGDGVPKNHKNKWLKPYGIADGTLITIDHIMSLLFYCNYTAQSYELSATYRRIYWNETDNSMKQRHSNLAHWARLLREVVDCFGYLVKSAPKRETMYYHGISRQLLFRGCTFHCFGPISTTTGLYIYNYMFVGTFHETQCKQKEKSHLVDLLKKKEWLLISGKELDILVDVPLSSIVSIGATLLKRMRGFCWVI